MSRFVTSRFGWFVGHVVCKQRFQRPFILSSIIFAPEAIAKAVTPHDILDVIPRCSNDILKSFTNYFFFDTVLYPRHARTKEFLSQQLLSKMAITSANVPDRQYAIKRLAVLSFERCLDLAEPTCSYTFFEDPRACQVLQQYGQCIHRDCAGIYMPTSTCLLQEAQDSLTERSKMRTHSYKNVEIHNR